MPSNSSRTAAELLAMYHAKRAAAIRRLWAGLHDEACVRYGSGPLTSGIGNATDAPEIIRMELRNLARAENDANDQSLGWWKLSGRKTSTWRRYRDSLR
jgi:hypothetical protein